MLFFCTRAEAKEKKISICFPFTTTYCNISKSLGCMGNSRDSSVGRAADIESVPNEPAQKNLETGFTKSKKLCAAEEF